LYRILFANRRKNRRVEEGPLKGWVAIARYHGIPVATAHRWVEDGMPVRREGRFTVAEREAIQRVPGT
jgi:hypothetical protein